MDPTGTPMDGRHHQPSGEPKEVVSPESGICSPLSWQGDGEDMAANTNTASPPLQPGSYPRRQDVSNYSEKEQSWIFKCVAVAVAVAVARGTSNNLISIFK